MNSFDACVIGQIVKDYNFLPVKGKKCVKLAGGTAFYSTHAYYTLGLKTAVEEIKKLSEQILLELK